MAIFNRIPFLKPRVRPVGDTLEQGESHLVRSKKRKNLAIKLALFLTVITATMFVFPRGQEYQYTVGVDDIWRQANLQAPFSFAIQKPEEEIERERAQIRATTPPIFVLDNQAVSRVQIRWTQFTESMDRVLGHYGDYQTNSTRGRLDEALADSISFASAQDSLAIRFTAVEWDGLLSSYASSMGGMVTSSRTVTQGERLDIEVASVAYLTANALHSVGVLNVEHAEIVADSVSIRDNETFRETPTAAAELLGLVSAFQQGNDQLALRWTNDAIRFGLTSKIFEHLLEPNLIYDETETRLRWETREQAILPSESIVHDNEVIVRRGDRITDDIHRKLTSLENELNQQAGNTVPWKTLAGQFILTLATFIIFFLYLFLLRRPIYEDNRMILLITLLFLSVIAIYGVALRAALLDMYVVPVAIVAILLTIIFDSRVAFFGSLTMAFVGSHLLNYDFPFTFATIFASSLGIFSVRDIRNRSQLLVSSSVVFVGYMSVFCANLLIQNTPIDRFQDLAVFAAINAFLLLLAYPVLWIFEKAFGVTTDLTLLELSDTNRPLLKELSLKAQGTFNHVLQVANLAETAAAAINANALLARVGALYHDIGKMVKPEYFVENQRGGVNPHDGLKPRMSALIIASHVKEGIDMAKKYRLPQVVEDFIPMHHGTTRIEYFYQRALTQHKQGDAAVQESEFRYPGPNPHSKETSILMLADGIEAASRALDNPTHKRLEGLIDSIVEARRVDGQLDEADLTFSELKRIKESFLGVLMGIYHVRVKYPGDREEESEEDWSGNDTTHALDG